MAAVPVVCTDDLVLVDQVITARKVVGDQLPSHGRELVPYFVPGAANMDEAAVNVNTDVDAHRQSGGHFLEIPVPAPSKTKKAQKKSRRSPLKQGGRVGKTVSAGNLLSMAPSAAPTVSSTPEPWAGPAYVNSPPPSSLPVPSFVLASQGSQKPASPLAARADFASPARGLRLFEDVEVLNPGLLEPTLEYSRRTAVEVSLKRILQVA